MASTHRATRQLTVLTLVIVIGSTSAGWATTVGTWASFDDPPSTITGILWGAVVGLGVSAAVAVHHSVRVFFGRTPEGETLAESRAPEERRAISRAAELTLPDATSMFAAVALVSAGSGGLTARIAPTAGLIAVLALFVSRLRTERLAHR